MMLTLKLNGTLISTRILHRGKLIASTPAVTGSEVSYEVVKLATHEAVEYLHQFDGGSNLC